jgi:hypothetical protein
MEGLERIGMEERFYMLETVECRMLDGLDYLGIFAVICDRNATIFPKGGASSRRKVRAAAKLPPRLAI